MFNVGKFGIIGIRLKDRGVNNNAPITNTNRGGVVSRSLCLTLIAAIGTMVLLYVIGFVGNIDFLIFRISISNTEIALLPIVVGVIVAIVGDRIMKSKSLE